MFASAWSTLIHWWYNQTHLISTDDNLTIFDKYWQYLSKLKIHRYFRTEILLLALFMYKMTWIKIQYVFIIANEWN